MMKTGVVRLLLLAILAPLAMAFTTPCGAQGSSSNTCLHMSKRFPAGRPNTMQVDEDMAMWFDDGKGNRKKALDKPVGGRPTILYSKEDVEKIEKKGVSPFERFKNYVEFVTKKPTRGY